MKKQIASERNIAKRLIIWAVIVAAILTIPLIGHWPWTAGDYVFGVIALFGSAIIYELITRNMSNINHRIAVGFGVAALLILVWIEMAVGIFD